MSDTKSDLFEDHAPQLNRRGYVVVRVDPDVEGTYKVLRRCPFCGKTARTDVPAQGLWDWEHGKFVQDAFPELSADDREQLTSGIHPACWDSMGDEE